MASNTISWSKIVSSKPLQPLTKQLASTSAIPPGSVQSSSSKCSSTGNVNETPLPKVSSVIVKSEQIQGSNSNNDCPSVASTSGAGTLPPLQKPKKRNKPNKEARLKRREQKALRAIYGPKDSHIHMISADVLQKLKNEGSGSSSSNTNSPRQFVQSTPHVIPNRIQYRTTDQNVWGRVPIPVLATETILEDFPSLSVSSQTQSQLQIDEAGWITENEEEKEEMNFTGAEADDTLKPDEISILNSASSIKFSKKKPSKNPILVSLQALTFSPPKISKKDKLQRKTKAEQSVNSNRGNILDSSGVIYKHRGKMRDKPKKKKPTKLKLAIMKSRLMRAAKALSAAVELDIRNDDEPQGETTVNQTDNFVQNFQVEEAKPEVKVEEVKLEVEVEEVKLEVKIEHAKLDVVTQTQLDNDTLINTSESYKEVKPNSESELISANADDNIFRKLFDDALKLSDDSKLKSEECTNSNEAESNSEDVKQQIPPDIFEEVKASMHSRKFRKYCDMFVSKELHGHVISIMSELFKFQDRLYHSDPIKYQSKKRFIHGIKDVIVYLKLNKLQLIIIAPDIEPNNAKGGLDEKLDEIISTAKVNNVPYVFSGNRCILGKPMRIKNPVSAIGILNKQGTEEFVRQLLEEATKLRDSYNSTFHSKAVSKMLERSNGSSDKLGDELEKGFTNLKI